MLLRYQAFMSREPSGSSCRNQLCRRIASMVTRRSGSGFSSRRSRSLHSCDTCVECTILGLAQAALPTIAPVEDTLATMLAPGLAGGRGMPGFSAL